MQKLYLDCDGVILDTIVGPYKILAEMGISEEEDVRAFYRQIDWKSLIIQSGEIDNACQKIEALRECGLFDISILSHVNSDNEASAKKEYFAYKLPGIEVITVPKGIEKADFVKANGAILVDDYLPNLEYWSEKGGISIKFSDSGKVCKFETITSLLELINGCKVKERVR